MPSTPAIVYRRATVADVPQIEALRVSDSVVGPADYRMAAYLEGRHHPRHAKAPRTMLVALSDETVVGYIGGHLSDRFGCDAEVQYLYVASPWRRHGVATELLRQLARWFQEHTATHVCVDVNPDSPQARPFYESTGAELLGVGGWMAWRDIRVWLSRSW